MPLVQGRVVNENARRNIQATDEFNNLKLMSFGYIARSGVACKFYSQTKGGGGGITWYVVVVVVVLLFYVHGKQLRSCRDGQLTLAHFSRAGLDLLSG